MGVRSFSSDGATSGIEAMGTGNGMGIVSSLGSKVGALVLGFFFSFMFPLKGSESWLAGRELDGERGCSRENLGFQLEIEAISALVTLPMGLDGEEAVCSADLYGDGMVASGVGSPRHSQSWIGVDGWAAEV